VIPEVILRPDEHSTDGCYARIRCPICKFAGWVDKDQYDGRISIQCDQPGCTYHEVHDLRIFKPSPGVS
jgi:hypothetical protein